LRIIAKGSITNLLHLHTQFNRDIPWGEIDMDFMNLNQSAHGDREFGFIMSRMRIERKVVVGHWQDKNVITQIAGWTRAALGWNDWQKVQNLYALAITCVMWR
jgi:L-arabinose isomerase